MNGYLTHHSLLAGYPTRTGVAILSSLKFLKSIALDDDAGRYLPVLWHFQPSDPCQVGSEFRYRVIARGDCLAILPVSSIHNNGWTDIFEK